MIFCSNCIGFVFTLLFYGMRIKSFFLSSRDFSASSVVFSTKILFWSLNLRRKAFYRNKDFCFFSLHDIGNSSFHLLKKHGLCLQKFQLFLSCDPVFLQPNAIASSNETIHKRFLVLKKCFLRKTVLVGLEQFSLFSFLMGKNFFF